MRDRARFLAGLVQSGGIGRAKTGSQGEREGGEAKVMLSEDDFARGVSVEDLAGERREGSEGDEERQTMTGEQVRQVLFDGKAVNGAAGASLSLCAALRSNSPDRKRLADPSTHSSAALGTFALALPGKRPFASDPLSHIPPYPTSVPPSSIRDPPAGSSSSPSPASGSATPLQGFGSDSFRPSGGAGGGRIVLTPGSSASSRAGTPGAGGAAQPGAAGRKKQTLNEFFESSEEESSDEEEEEDDDEAEEESSGEGEDEDDEEEEAEDEDGEVEDENTSSEDEGDEGRRR